MAIAISLHILGAIIWVGGMFFAYMALRPVAAAQLEPPQRLPLWLGTFRCFFPWVWLSVVVLLGSGYWMLFAVFGGFAGAGVHVHIMHGLGLLMVALYAWVYFRPFRTLAINTAAGTWPEAGAALNRIRQVIRINLSLGLMVVVVASAGRYL